MNLLELRGTAEALFTSIKADFVLTWRTQKKADSHRLQYCVVKHYKSEILPGMR